MPGYGYYGWSSCIHAACALFPALDPCLSLLPFTTTTSGSPFGTLAGSFREGVAQSPCLPSHLAMFLLKGYFPCLAAPVSSLASGGLRRFPPVSFCFNFLKNAYPLLLPAVRRPSFAFAPVVLLRLPFPPVLLFTAFPSGFRSGLLAVPFPVNSPRRPRGWWFEGCFKSGNLSIFQSKNTRSTI